METLIADTFEPPSWRPDPRRPHPIIELRELVLMRVFALPNVDILRRVTFRRGLNIIWADPKTEQARKGGPRTSGHSAGKTTLCRILRWVLGETHFASPYKEHKLATELPK